MAAWTSASLKGVAFGGLIRPDIMDKIFDVSRIPLPMQDMVGTSSVSNSYAEWTTDKLAAPDVANAVVDGADVSQNNAAGGARVGNQCQISVKEVQVSKRANASDTIGRANELAYQVMMRQQELRRDVDAIFVGNQASQADNGTVPGHTGGLRAWLKTHVSFGLTGANGGFASGVVGAATPGTKRAGSFKQLKDLLQAIYQDGGNPRVLMSGVGVIRGLSEYMFASTAQIATLQSDQGGAKAALTARGAVNVFVSDFGVVVELQDNRLQQAEAGGGYDLFLLDPQYIELGLLTGYQTEPLAKSGLSEKRLMSVDWTVKVLAEVAQGCYADIDPALAWTA